MSLESLKLDENKRTVIIGIGSELRGDDYAGLKVIDEMRAMGLDAENLLLIQAGNMPEKFTSSVKEFDPDNVLLIDSVEADMEPGSVSLVDPSDIVTDSVSSHKLPLSKLMNYLEEETEARIDLVGIQVKDLEVGSGLSEQVKDSIKNLVEFFVKELTQS